MKKHILSIMIFCFVIFFSLGVGVFSLNKTSIIDVDASTLSGSEEVMAQAPANLSDLQNASSVQLDYWASNLSSFDGREFDIITPARSQGNKEICWAYAAVGAVEASILREGIDESATNKTLNLDEMAAAYTSNKRDGEQDPLLLTTNDKFYYGTWNQGGNAVNALAMMTQGYTLIDEQYFSYSATDDQIKSELTQSKYYVQSYKKIAKDQNAIKRAVLQYGAVTFNYKAPASSYNKYFDDTEAINHASIIVGWDDNVDTSNYRPKTPTQKGAWIVKNSWGSHGHNKNGTYCYYLSYQTYMNNQIYAVDLAMRDEYQNIYHYDGNLSVSLKNYVADAQAAIYEAKLSSATKQEQLKAVMIAVPEGNLDVTVKIYKGLQVNPGNVNDKINKPNQNDPVAQVKTHLDCMGMHTIDLETPINLDQGEYFSIVVSCKNEYNSPVSVACSSDSYASVNDMTYYLYNGVWTSYKNSKYYADTSTDNMSARIRAITNVVDRETDLGKNLQYARVEIANRLLFYQKGNQIQPQMQVYFDDKLLEEEHDYKVDIDSNNTPGMVTINIKGINDYYGTRTTCFEIAKAENPPGYLSGTITVYRDTIMLHNISIPPDWEWVDLDEKLEFGTRYWPVSIRYVGSDKAFYQNLTCDFYVNKVNEDPPADINISDAVVEVVGTYAYTGDAIIPDVKVTYQGKQLNFGTDYTLSFQDNTNVGQATVIVTGNGRYYGQTSQVFQIEKALWPIVRPNSTIIVNLNVTKLSDVPLNCKNWEWQDSNVQITEDTFFATAIYVGEDSICFVNTQMQIEIKRKEQKDIASITILKLDTTIYVYDGKAKFPNVIAIDQILLKAGQDYEVEYQNNLYAGEASAAVKGINNYTGQVTLYYTIKRADRPMVDTTIICTEQVESLQDVTLPPNFQWVDGMQKITAGRMTAKAIYVGDDADNFIEKEVLFEIIFTQVSTQPSSLIWLISIVPVVLLLAIWCTTAILRHKKKEKWKKYNP